jgi:hypothetical protein
MVAVVAEDDFDCVADLGVDDRSEKAEVIPLGWVGASAS